MLVGVTITKDDATKISTYARDKRLSMSAAIRLLAIERLIQLEEK